MSVQPRMGPHTVPGVPCPPWPRPSPSQLPLLVCEGATSASCDNSRSHPARFSGELRTHKATRKMMRGGAQERLEGASPLPPGEGEGEGPCIQLEVHTPERSPAHRGHPRTRKTKERGRGQHVAVPDGLTFGGEGPGAGLLGRHSDPPPPARPRPMCTRQHYLPCKAAHASDFYFL